MRDPARSFGHQGAPRRLFDGGISLLRPILDHFSSGAGPLLHTRRKTSSRLRHTNGRTDQMVPSLRRISAFTFEWLSFHGRTAGRVALRSVSTPVSQYSSAGFTAITLIAFLPLVLTLVTAAAGATYIFKQKLSAQSMCVQQATTLQNDLKPILTQLLRLNPQATRLRARRAKADAAVKKALMTKNPKLIAAAKAIQLAVILQQTALRAKQERLLHQAQEERARHHNRLSNAVRKKFKSYVKSKQYYPRALAVEPRPAGSLTPDYRPVNNFAFHQQHEFRFDITIAPSFVSAKSKQKILCSLSLSGKESSWRPHLIAANP